VIGELWTGFVGGRKADQNLELLRAFLASPVVEELVVDGEIGRFYGEILASLRNAGTTVPTNDIWIAACAARHGATVLTFDHHFSVIKRVGSVILSSSE
jgi:tRNA(fMet)-specific endonuclease VapC